MRFGKYSMAALAATMLVVAPVAAQAAPTAKSTAAVKRVGADRVSESKQDGGSGSGILMAVLAAGAIIAGIVVAAGGNNDTAKSP